MTIASDIKHTSHIRAFKSFKKDGTVLQFSAEHAALLLDTTPFGEEHFEIPGENPVAISDEEFERIMTNVVLELDAQEAVAVAAAPVDNVSLDFLARCEAVDTATSERMVWDIANRIDDRLARAVDDAPIKIKNLERARTKMVTGRVALALCAAGRDDASFINRSVMAGTEFNVYALFKLPDLIAGLMGGAIGNAINIAVVKSMFALEKAGIPFDFDTAKAAASSEHAPARMGVRSHLTRHTVAKGTASTQAGSTMHALKALGVVDFDQSKNPTYKILDNATTTALRNARFFEEDAA